MPVNTTRSVLFFFLVTITSSAFGAHFITLDTGVVGGSYQTISAWGVASAQDENTHPVGISGAMGLYEGFSTSWETVNSTQFFEPVGEWSESNLNATGYPGLCYNSGLTVQTSEVSRTVYGTEICVPAPPSSPPPPTQTVDNPNEGQCESRSDPCWNSPIMFNFDHRPWRITRAADGVAFDINADGARESLAWPEAGTLQGFLAIDRNGNGSIDDGSELFGNHTRLKDGSRAANGFVALAELDTNADGWVDSSDTKWLALLIWIDSNHDGVSQHTELARLAEFGLSALSHEAHWTDRRDRNGNLFSYQALYRAGGRTNTYYDVFLRMR